MKCPRCPRVFVTFKGAKQHVRLAHHEVLLNENGWTLQFCSFDVLPEKEASKE